MIKKQRNVVYTVKNVIFFTKCLKTTITNETWGVKPNVNSVNGC